MADTRRRQPQPKARDRDQRPPASRKEHAMAATESSETSTNPTSRESALQPFVTAYREYRTALGNAVSVVELRRLLAEAQREYQAACTDAVVPKQVRDQAATALRNLGSVARGVSTPEELQQRVGEALDAYRQTFGAFISPTEARQRASQASTQYARQVQEALAPDALQKRVAEAHAACLTALADAWKACDELPDTRTLHAIAQTISGAATLRAAADAAVSQRWAMAASVSVAAAGHRGVARSQ
jgi:hypothetical protein